MLADEFPEIPVNYINNTLRSKKHLFATFVQLFEEFDQLASNPNPPFRKVRARMKKPGARNDNFDPNEISKELEAAKRKVFQQKRKCLLFSGG
jgi:hypothetical protein